MLPKTLKEPKEDKQMEQNPNYAKFTSDDKYRNSFLRLLWSHWRTACDFEKHCPDPESGSQNLVALPKNVGQTLSFLRALWMWSNNIQLCQWTILLKTKSFAIVSPKWVAWGSMHATASSNDATRSDMLSSNCIDHGGMRHINTEIHACTLNKDKAKDRKVLRMISWMIAEVLKPNLHQFHPSIAELMQLWCGHFCMGVYVMSNKRKSQESKFSSSIHSATLSTPLP